jgi:hypothetical protein
VWDTFTIACLFDDSARIGNQLIVPNTGIQKDRFTEAIRAQNLHFQLYSQPELSH